MRRIEFNVKGALSYPQPGLAAAVAANPLQWPPRGAQMSKVYAVLLVVVALITMAAIGTLGLVVVTDVGYLAYQIFKPGMSP
jgi:hypothetical protein